MERTVGKVLTASVRGVEVRLNDQSEASAHDTVAVTAAQARLHAADAFIRNALHKADVEAHFVPLDHGPAGQPWWRVSVGTRLGAKARAALTPESERRAMRPRSANSEGS